MDSDINQAIDSFIKGPAVIGKVHFSTESRPASEKALSVDFPRLEIMLAGQLRDPAIKADQAQLTPHDVLIAPRLEGLTSADFNRAREFMDQGEVQAEAMVLRMQDLQMSEADYAAWQAARQRRQPPPPTLQFVRTEGSELTRPDRRADMFASQPGQVFDGAGCGEQVVAGQLPVFGIE